jgi:hypothetical protein
MFKGELKTLKFPSTKMNGKNVNLFVGLIFFSWKKLNLFVGLIFF